MLTQALFLRAMAMLDLRILRHFLSAQWLVLAIWMTTTEAETSRT